MPELQKRGSDFVKSPKAHVELSLSTSSSTISISDPSAPPTQAIVKARILESSRPSSPVTLEVNGNPLDGGHGSFHDALFRNAFSLVDVADPSRHIMLSPPVRVNYGSRHDQDQRAIEHVHFATIPSKGQGELVVRYDLTLDRLFYCQHYPMSLKREEVRSGDRFRLRMRKCDRVRWWAFGDLEADLPEKKFAGEWEEPDAGGRFGNFEIDGLKPDVEMMRRDGWVFSEHDRDLEMRADSEDGVVLEFI